VSARGLTTQYNSTWGLGAISHRSGSNDSYIYDSTAGEVTYAYVLDTGILISHEHFGGRATLGSNPAGGEHVNDYGHDTHVAATIEGFTYGVAKKASRFLLKPLRSTPCSKALPQVPWERFDYHQRRPISTRSKFSGTALAPRLVSLPDTIGLSATSSPTIAQLAPPSTSPLSAKPTKHGRLLYRPPANSMFSQSWPRIMVTSQCPQRPNCCRGRYETQRRVVHQLW
jgi:subtilisin family serine protease